MNIRCYGVELSLSDTKYLTRPIVPCDVIAHCRRYDDRGNWVCQLKLNTQLSSSGHRIREVTEYVRSASAGSNLQTINSVWHPWLHHSEYIYNIPENHSIEWRLLGSSCSTLGEPFLSNLPSTTNLRTTRIKGLNISNYFRTNLLLFVVKFVSQLPLLKLSSTAHPLFQ